MKRFVLALLFAAVCLSGQGRTVNATWTDSLNPAGTTYNLYQLTGSCPMPLPAAKPIQTGITTKTFAVPNVAPGLYCFFATAGVVGSTESGPSNTASLVLLSAPTGFTLTIAEVRVPWLVPLQGGYLEKSSS